VVARGALIPASSVSRYRYLSVGPVSFLRALLMLGENEVKRSIGHGPNTNKNTTAGNFPIPNPCNTARPARISLNNRGPHLNSSKGAMRPRSDGSRLWLCGRSRRRRRRKRPGKVIRVRHFAKCPFAQASRRTKERSAKCFTRYAAKGRRALARAPPVAMAPRVLGGSQCSFGPAEAKRRSRRELEFAVLQICGRSRRRRRRKRPGELFRESRCT
jgi:hypothetical protein